MPAPGQGRQWHCSRCGLGGFREYNECHQHEMLCDPFSSRKRRRPGTPIGSNTMNQQPVNQSFNQSMNYKAEENQPYFLTDIDQQSQAQQPPTKTPMKEPRFKPFIFLPNTEQPPEKLSPLDIVTCQNVEVFKASAADVADHEGSGGMTVHKNQIGFRCIHCAKTPFAKAEYSSVFPGSLGSVAASLQLMTKYHFGRCTVLNQETKIHLQNVRNSFHGDEDDEEWYTEAFVEHSLDMCKRLNIVNRSPPQTGIVLGDNKKSSSNSVGGDSSRYSSSGDPTMQYTKNGNPTQQSLAQYSSVSSTSQQQYPMQNQMRNDEKALAQSSSAARETSPSIGTAPTRSGSPPSLFDSPGSVNFPYFQNQQGFWECRFCWGYPQRPQGCFWNSTQPPPRNFIEQHLNMCQNYLMSQNVPNQPQNQLVSQPNQYDNVNQPWLTPKSKQTQYAQNSSNLFNSPQTGNRPPVPRPPSCPPTFTGTEGMNPQEAYAYQQMQMFNQMQMYQQGGVDFNQNYGGFQQGMFPNQNMDTCVAIPFEQQKTSMGSRSEATLKATLQYLEDEEKRIESQKRDPEEEANDRQLVLPDDKSLLTDYFFHIMKQLRFCQFSESDRKTRGGKRDNIKVGFGGLKCVHCSDSQNSRKFFWSNVDRLANSFAEIPSHVLKCRRCPVQTKQALQSLKQRHSEQMTQLPRGSQKVFFRRMWRRLHDVEEDEGKETNTGNDDLQATKDSTSAANDVAESIETSKDDRSSQGNIIVGMSTECAAKALADYAAGIKPYTRILLSIDEDKSWLSDMDCFIRSNLEVFCASKYDVEFAESERKYPITEGQIGIRCIHCATSKGGARGTAVSFPPFVGGIYESVREFHRVHLPTCPHLPEKAKNKLQTLKGSSSLSSVLRKYYVEAAEALGIYDSDEGMRGGGDTKPVGWKEGNNTNLSESIRQMESSNQEFFNIHGQEPMNKKRKVG